jgi:hypothetical protein
LDAPDKIDDAHFGVFLCPSRRFVVHELGDHVFAATEKRRQGVINARLFSMFAFCPAFRSPSGFARVRISGHYLSKKSVRA